MSNAIKQSTKLSDKIVLLLFFAYGFMADPFSKNANPWSLKFVFTIVLALSLLTYFIYKLYKSKDFKVLNSKVLVTLFALSLFPLLSAVVNWQNWYRNIFIFRYSVLIIPLFAIISFALANLYNELRQFIKIMWVTFLGLFISSQLSLLVLILNHFDVIGFPNFEYRSIDIVNNVLILGIVLMLLAPHIYKYFVKTKNSKVAYWLVAAIVITEMVIFININFILVLLAVVLATLVLSGLFSSYAYLYFGIIIVTSALGLLIGLVNPIKEFKKEVVSSETAGITQTANITFNALKDNNPVLGMSNYNFEDTSQIYAPTNHSSNFKPNYEEPFSYFFQLLISDGLLILIPMAALVVVSFTAMKKLFHKKDNKNTIYAELFVRTIIPVFFMSIIFFSVPFDLWLLVSIAFALLAHYEVKDYAHDKVWKLNLKFLSVILLPGLCVLLVLSSKILIGNYFYGYASELFKSKNIENQKKALQYYQDSVDYDNHQWIYQEELSKLFYGVFAVSQNKLDLLSDTEKTEVQKYFNNVVKYSNNSISLNSDGYITWILRFNLMKNLSNFSDTSDTVSRATENLERIAPKNGELLLSLASYYVDIDLNRSHMLVAKAYEGNPNVDKVKLEYAKSLVVQGKKEDAIKLLTELTSDETKVNDQNYQEAALVLKNLLIQQQPSTPDQNQTLDSTETQENDSSIVENNETQVP